MDIPLNVDVHCTDGLAGRSTNIILNPVTKNVTHLVVAARKAPHNEYLVPLKKIKATASEVILLNCLRQELVQMEPFYETHFVRTDVPDLMGLPDDALMWPYHIPLTSKTYHITDEAIPPDELGVRRGTHVIDCQGEIVGMIDEFLVEPEEGNITHLVLAQGHLWGKREITIPVYEIERIAENQVRLKLDKKAISHLPAVPARR